jgi:hypothetical protein
MTVPISNEPEKSVDGHGQLRKHRTKKYFDDNRQAIEADIKVLGVGKALKKWEIASGTFSGISRRWKEADRKANSGKKSTEESPEQVEVDMKALLLKTFDFGALLILAEIDKTLKEILKALKKLQNPVNKKKVLRT